MAWSPTSVTSAHWRWVGRYVWKHLLVGFLAYCPISALRVRGRYVWKHLLVGFLAYCPISMSVIIAGSLLCFHTNVHQRVTWQVNKLIFVLFCLFVVARLERAGKRFSECVSFSVTWRELFSFTRRKTCRSFWAIPSTTSSVPRSCSCGLWNTAFVRQQSASTVGERLAELSHTLH